MVDRQITLYESLLKYEQKCYELQNNVNAAILSQLSFGVVFSPNEQINCKSMLFFNELTI